MFDEVYRQRVNALSNQVIGAAIEVHRTLGPGLLESAYEECLCHEFGLRHIPFEAQKTLPVQYKGRQLSSGYRLDLLVDHLLIIELKAIDQFDPVHEAQLLTYLRLSNLWLGLLINFNVTILKSGIKRLVSG